MRTECTRKKKKPLLISDIIDYKTKTIIRDKCPSYLSLMKRSMNQEDITIINVHGSNNVANNNLTKTNRIKKEK